MLFDVKMLWWCEHWTSKNLNSKKPRHVSLVQKCFTGKLYYDSQVCKWLFQSWSRKFWQALREQLYRPQKVMLMEIRVIIWNCQNRRKFCLKFPLFLVLLIAQCACSKNHKTKTSWRSSDTFDWCLSKVWFYELSFHGSTLRSSIMELIDLPNENLLEIFKHLSANKDISNVSLVCKRFNQISCDDSLWAHFARRDYAVDIKLINPNSVKIIYQKLLHLFGPLLGLWQVWSLFPRWLGVSNIFVCFPGDTFYI